MTYHSALLSRAIEVEAALHTDRPIDILRFIRDGVAAGYRCALVTLVEIIDGASRSLGTHMAVRDDGRYCGFVSGGCVEAAVAREALEAIFEQRDRLCRYGKGSPYFDIVLPCGGGICLAIHVLKNGDAIGKLIDGLDSRSQMQLLYDPAGQQLSAQSATYSPASWRDGLFVTSYHPELRILVFGQGYETRTFSTVAMSLGIEVVGANSERLASLADDDTAIVLLNHDMDRELPVLRQALLTKAFYIGCLGSRRTHSRRKGALATEGFSTDQIERIRGPIGLFGPAREARALAVSVLAEIMWQRELRRQ